MNAIERTPAQRFERLEQVRQFFDRLWAAIEDCSPATAKRDVDVAAVALHSVALEHASAIIALIEAGWSASAFALLRPMTDAYLRARWIRECADEQALRKAVQGDDFPGVGSMLKALEEGSEDRREGVRRLRAFHKTVQETLHSFSHGGRAQLIDRVHEHGIQGRPPDERVEGTLTLAVGYAGLVAGCLWVIYEDEKLMTVATSLLKEVGIDADSDSPR